MCAAHTGGTTKPLPTTAAQREECSIRLSLCNGSRYTGGLVSDFQASKLQSSTYATRCSLPHHVHPCPFHRTLGAILVRVRYDYTFVVSKLSSKIHRHFFGVTNFPEPATVSPVIWNNVKRPQDVPISRLRIDFFFWLSWISIKHESWFRSLHYQRSCRTLSVEDAWIRCWATACLYSQRGVILYVY